MLFRLIGETFLRRKKRVAWALAAVALGATLASALLSLSADLSGRMARELRAYGANILVTPRGEGLVLEIAGVNLAPATTQELLDETELPKLKTIFWRNNIVGFAPYLSLTARAGGKPVLLTGTWFEKELALPLGTLLVSGLGQEESLSQGQTFQAGVKDISPWWQVSGEWVKEGDSEGALVGASLAEELGLGVGDSFRITYEGRERALTVRGLLRAGGLEDGQVFVNLPVAQDLLGVERGASKVLVSALVQPKEKLNPKVRNKKPEEMTPEEYEIWYCSPVIEAITTQIEEALPDAHARPIRAISEAEGAFITKTQLFMGLVTLVALATSTLAVMTTMTTMVLERRGDIGLQKALGAEDGQIVFLFLLEAGTIGLVGGAMGYLFGLGLGQLLAGRVFGTSLSFLPALIPVTLLLALGVSLLGSALPVWQAVRAQPVALLREQR